jgi:hypothetical protein
MNPGKLIGFGIIIVVIVLALAQSTYVVDPGFRGVLVTLGKVSDEAKPEGFGTKSPFISHLVRVPVRQLTQSVDAECYSSDLQQLTVVLQVLYRIPESAVVDEDGRPTAYVLLDGEHFLKRDLELGIRDTGFVQVKKGLEVGERVVTKGGYAIRLASVSSVIPAHGHAH